MIEESGVVYSDNEQGNNKHSRKDGRFLPKDSNGEQKSVVSSSFSQARKEQKIKNSKRMREIRWAVKNFENFDDIDDAKLKRKVRDVLFSSPFFDNTFLKQFINGNSSFLSQESGDVIEVLNDEYDKLGIDYIVKAKDGNSFFIDLKDTFDSDKGIKLRLTQTLSTRDGLRVVDDFLLKKENLTDIYAFQMVEDKKIMSEQIENELFNELKQCFLQADRPFKEQMDEYNEFVKERVVPQVRNGNCLFVGRKDLQDSVFKEFGGRDSLESSKNMLINWFQDISDSESAESLFHTLNIYNGENFTIKRSKLKQNLFFVQKDISASGNQNIKMVDRILLTEKGPIHDMYLMVKPEYLSSLKGTQSYKL